jgi:hypothetical protein
MAHLLQLSWALPAATTFRERPEGANFGENLFHALCE